MDTIRDITRAIAELREIADALRPHGFWWDDRQRAEYILAKRLARIADELAAASDASVPARPVPASD